MAETVPVAMEPILGTTLPSGPEWRWQVKWDGIRCLSTVGADGVRLWSRRGHAMEAAFPDVAGAVRQAVAGSDAIVDGEIVVLGPDGRPSFPLALGRLLRRPGGGGPPASYAIFDLLAVDDADMRARGLEERLAVLAARLRPVAGIHMVETRAQGGAGMLRAAADLGLEGVVAKRAGSPYVPGHSAHWLKFKVRRRLEAFVGGFRPNPSGGLRSLCLVHPGADGWTYLGDAGSGLSAAQSAGWLAALAGLPAWTPPFTPPPGRRWVQPDYRVHVTFAEFTPEGRLRAPVLVRADPPAATVAGASPPLLE